MIAQSAVAAGVLAAAILPNTPEMEPNVVHLQATGCGNCYVYAVGHDSWTEGSWEQQVKLPGTLYVPKEVESVGITVHHRRIITGSNNVTLVALRYKGFKPGDRVTNRQSKNAKRAKACLDNNRLEQTLKFKVKWDRNPKKFKYFWEGGRKHRDQTWTKYTLRAWAVPQMRSSAPYWKANNGTVLVQQVLCGW